MGTSKEILNELKTIRKEIERLNSESTNLMYENARLQKVIDTFAKVTEPVWGKGPGNENFYVGLKTKEVIWKDEDEIAFEILKPYAKRRY